MIEINRFEIKSPKNKVKLTLIIPVCLIFLDSSKNRSNIIFIHYDKRLKQTKPNFKCYITVYTCLNKSNLLFVIKHMCIFKQSEIIQIVFCEKWVEVPNVAQVNVLPGMYSIF